MAMSAKDYVDFVQGQRDRDNNLPAKENQSDHYNRGYGTQYELEQINDWMSEHGFK